MRLELPERLGGAELDLVSRVEDVTSGAEGTLLVLAAPSFAGDLDVAVPGRNVTVDWATERGQCHQEFSLLRVVRHRLPCWELLPLSQVVFRQRRRFVRTSVTGPAVLHSMESAVSQADVKLEDKQLLQVGVHLVDLSEGGTCVRGVSKPWVVGGRRVHVEFELDGVPVVQLAEVLRVNPVPSEAAVSVEHREFDVVLAFVEPVSEADRIRRHVIQIQIQNRRRGDR